MGSTTLPGASGDCPCGTGTPYDGCCGPLHRNERQAAGVEELMRSRYSAYAVGAFDHLFRTWHPRTRPEDLVPDERLRWTGLQVLGSSEEDETGTVEFRAHWSLPDSAGVLHENSLFARRGGRWVYVEALQQGG